MIHIPLFPELLKQIESQTAEDVQRALIAGHPGIVGLAAMLSPAAEAYLERMAKRSEKLTAQRFGRTTQIYAPLYLSNFCGNRCRYCGFSSENRIERRMLTLEEAGAEAMILYRRGFNHILLVSGEAPSRLGTDYLERLSLRLRDKFAALSIEVQPLTMEEYCRLFAAGITGVAIYQETYNREIYEQVHVSGEKCDFNSRLDIPARAAAAGMREVGIGALLGLSDWRADGLALGVHLAALRKQFWRTSFTISFPRLRPATGDFEPLVDVSEKNLAQLIFALRIFDPDVGIILSTREEPRYRDGMIGLGPTRYSAGSCTTPGGYAHPEFAGEQFVIGDHRSLDEVCRAIKEKGYDPVRKDWDVGFQLLENR